MNTTFREFQKMDLGIRGKTAIVCASSKGLGRGCARALAGEGVDVVINARNKTVLEATARDIEEATGVKVTAVVADIATPEGRAAVLEPAPIPTSSSPTAAARRPEISAIGTGRPGSKRSTPTC